MTPLRLNLDSLRQRNWPTIDLPGEPRGVPANLDDGKGPSRRRFLALAGAGLSALVPFPESVARGHKTFDMVGDSNRLAFVVAERECWVVDASRFAGKPELRVTCAERLIRLAFRNARFPGTQLRADFVAELRPSLTGWNMRLRFLGSILSTELPFEQWLAGRLPATSRMGEAGTICRLGPNVRLSLAPQASFEYFPDWVLRFHGSSVAQLSGFDTEALLSDGVLLTLRDLEHPSLLIDAQEPASLFTIERGGHEWSVVHRLRVASEMKCQPQRDLFDRIIVQASEREQALVAEALGQDSRLTFCPDHDVRGSDGRRLQLPLQEPRYAVAWNSSGEQTALVAEFPKEPVWLHSKGCVAQVGRASKTSRFEVSHADGVTQTFRCAPQVLRATVSLPGAIVEAAPPTEDCCIDLIADASAGQRQAELPKTDQPAVILSLRDPFTTVTRPEDLLCLGFKFTNLTLTSGARPHLTRTNLSLPAYITAILQPQYIGEEALFEQPGTGFHEDPSDLHSYPPGDQPKPNAPVAARIAGSNPITAQSAVGISDIASASRLVFSVPQGIDEIPYTLESLLDWTRFEMKVAGAALPAALTGGTREGESPLPPCSAPKTGTLPTTAPSSANHPAFPGDPNLDGALELDVGIKQPDALTTSIEAPYRLMISPSSLGAWGHKANPAAFNGWTELWHTRLGVRRVDGTADELSPAQRIIRAIWSPDWSPGGYPKHDFAPSQIRMSLDRNDRHQLVELTADWLNIKSGGKYQAPLPVQVNRLMLSALGAWLDCRGQWPATDNLSVVEWTHRAQMGRDSYVQVVYQGYLLPFGHRASLIKVTERKIDRSVSGEMTAYLFQRLYIVVRQPEKSFSFLAAHANEGRDFPFCNLQITTITTPDLDDPTKGPGAIKSYGQSVFWPYVSQQPFRFHVIAEDLEKHVTEFAIPMIFVDRSLAFSTPDDQFGYKTESTGRSTASLPSTNIAYAPSKKPGDTSFTTTAITFSASPLPPPLAGAAVDQPSFYPIVAQADVNIPAVSQLLGPAANGSTSIALDSDYVKKGFVDPTNVGEVFAQLLQPVNMDFAGNNAGDKGGGLLSPSMMLSGLSRELGTVAGNLGNLKFGLFDPASVFAEVQSATLLGGISLTDIIGELRTSNFEDAPEALRIKTQINYPSNGANGLAPPQSIDTTITWTPALKSSRLFSPSSDGNSNDGSLDISASIHTDLTTANSSSLITGKLHNFTLNFFDELYLTFSSFDFVFNTGQKVKATPVVSNVRFAKELSFVSALTSTLQQGGSNWGGLTIDVEPLGISVKDSVALPDIAVGIMSLQNLAFSAELAVPFTANPATLTFLFCSKAKPFVMSYCGFAGGGYFAITASTGGIKSTEISLWFGGSVAINLGVASGGVHMMGGIDISVASDSFTVTAFVQLGGSLCVLGIITVSIEFDLTLTYAEHYEGMSDVLLGQCTLTIQIDVALFSKSVDLIVERVITSSGGVQATALELPQGASKEGRDIKQPPATSVSAPAFTDLMDEPTWDQVYLTAFAA